MIMGLENSGLKISADLIKTNILQEVKIEDQESSSALMAKKRVFKKDVKSNGDFRCFNCNEHGHIARNCPFKSEKKREGNSSLCASLSSGAVKSGAWYIDSGVTCHMTKHREWIVDMKQKNDTVNVANNHQAKVKGVGNCGASVNCGNSRNDVDIKNVLYVLELSTNLLSVSKITEKGNTVIFTKTSCQVIDSKNRVIATGRIDGGLYRLNEFRENCVLTSTSSNRRKTNRSKK